MTRPITTQPVPPAPRSGIMSALSAHKETPGHPRFPCPLPGAGLASPGPGGIQHYAHEDPIMYPINDIDAQLLLATLIASKRRPAELVEIVAAADVLGCPVTSGNLWAESFRRFATHDLMVAVDGRYALTPAALALGEKLPKKADTAERVFLVRERLSEYTPAEKTASIPMSVEQMEAAMAEHAANAKQGGKNLLMPKPKLTEEEEQRRRGPHRRFGGRGRG